METYKTVTFSTQDSSEVKRLAKADDMASCLWELIHNGWRQFKHTDYDYERAWNAIREIVNEYHIDVDDLWE